MPRPRHNDIEKAQDALLEKKKAYLTRRGWRTSCGFPDSRWYWTKRIKARTNADGRHGLTTISVALADAIRLQCCLDCSEGTTY